MYTLRCPILPSFLSLMLMVFTPLSSPFARACLRACQRNSLVHIIMMTRAELVCVFNKTAIKKRMHRFAVLAMSSHSSHRFPMSRIGRISDSSPSTPFPRASLRRGFKLSTTHMPSSNDPDPSNQNVRCLCSPSSASFS
ncbi:hypothetical protein F5888DRAFT_365154 [Russula emetica]|nr:hypothetical protein F5888DRAFT_365154 [Russula emetica]